MDWLAAVARGRGIATRAVVLLSDWALQNLRLERITLKALLGNVRSQNVAERAGFVPVNEEENFPWFERKKGRIEIPPLVPKASGSGQESPPG